MAYIGTAPSRSPLSSTQFDADITLTDSLTVGGSTPTVTIGDAGAEDTKLVFDGNAQDFYIGLDDGTDDLLIGLGSAVGTTPAIAIDENLDIVTSGNIITTVAHDGGDTSITINNSAGGGSTDETATLAFQHASQPGGKISSLRDADYGANDDEDSKLAFYTGQNGTDNLKMLLGETGWLHTGNSVDGNVNTTNDGGLTINQGSKDDEIISLKSSDVTTGLGNFAATETDTFGSIRKVEGVGGLYIAGMKPHNYGTNALMLEGFADGNGLSTTKTSSGVGGINIVYNGHDGSNAVDALAADSVVLSVRGNSIGGTHRTLFIVDEDGDLHVDGSTSLTAFDAWDDAALLRSYELWREGETEGELSDQMLKSRYDANKYTKEQLGLAKVIHVVADEDWAPSGPDTEQSLVNTGALGRITTGAVWQNHEMLDAIIETMEERDSGFTAALKKKFVARGLPTQILDWTGDIPDDLVKPDVAPKAFNAE